MLKIYLSKWDKILDELTSITPLVTNAEVSILSKFYKFLDKVISKHLSSDEPPDWLKYVIDKVYEGGVEKSFRYTKRRHLKKVKSKLDALKTFKETFNTSDDLKKAELLYTRANQEFKSFGDKVSAKIARTFTEGFIQNKSPSEISKMLRDQAGIELKKAKNLVNHELVRVHSEGALDAMEKLGVEEIEVEVEWSTAGDGKVCPLCKSMENAVIPIKKARGLFPRHVGCRCSPIPSSRKYNRKVLISKIKDSISAERPKTISRTLQDQIGKTRWMGKKFLGIR